jgi:hypothetical protein
MKKYIVKRLLPIQMNYLFGSFQFQLSSSEQETSHQCAIRKHTALSNNVRVSPLTHFHATRVVIKNRVRTTSRGDRRGGRVIYLRTDRRVPRTGILS